MSRVNSLAPFASALAAVLVAVPAYAHISLEMGGTHLSRYGDADDAIKEAPCGQAGGSRGTHVYTYAAGQTITVTLVEAIPHPGYYRIAFDDDGDDGFVDPVSIDAIDPARACPIGPGDHCGTSDFYNTLAVLPNMDNLIPHLPAPTDFLNPPTRTFQVTLPNVSCTNCTLQIIQVMEDDLFHGPYDTTPGVGVPDVYHQCIDLVLTGGPPPGAGGAGPGAGGAVGAAGAVGVAGGPGASGAGGYTGPGGGTGGVPGAVGGAATGQGGVGTQPGPGPGGSGTGAPGGVAGFDPGDDSDASSSDSGSCSAAGARSSRGGFLALSLLAGALGSRRARRRRA